jgi:hypothetical protein
MKNYQIISLETWSICESDLTLKEAFAGVLNSAPFGIRNSSTGNMVCYRLMRGFTPTKNQINILPKKSERMANLNHKWNYHPKQ